MKGIVLAGGRGSRLYPLTAAVSKQLLPVYNKPMIYYPLSCLLLAGLREILIVCTSEDKPRFRNLLGDGSTLGVRLAYAVQDEPRGIADALLVGIDFVGDDSIALILGDNLFYGQGLANLLQQAAHLSSGAHVFAYYVRHPERYGVIQLAPDGTALNLEEKPAAPASSYAVPGLYFYDNSAIEIARSLSPSERGELEITDVNRAYLRRGELAVQILGRGIAWLDTGTHPSLLQAANFIEAVEQRQGLLIGSIEEVAFRMGFIDPDQLRRLGAAWGTNAYGEYLMRIADEATRVCPSATEPSPSTVIPLKVTAATDSHGSMIADVSRREQESGNKNGTRNGNANETRNENDKSCLDGN